MYHIMNGMGMGLTTMTVLIMSNFVISALRKIIPSRMRIPAYIVIVASLVTMHTISPKLKASSAPVSGFSIMPIVPQKSMRRISMRSVHTISLRWQQQAST